MKKIKIDRNAVLLFIFCALVTLPFLGLAEFNTKGEPREAVVAYSILESGDWILPTNNGGEIPYKPPFFHWCIALASLLNGGVVNEFTSRFPSAIALILMTVWTYVFFARRKNVNVALATALVAFTTFELHRAGANCRVDMLLTFATVGAIYSFYSWFEKGMKGLPWISVAMMSVGTLTKGPVGIVVPMMVAFLLMLYKKCNFWRTCWVLLASSALSLVIPACWYVLAYMQAGDEFLDLVLEENIGRMTSTMSYESCVNPWPYNILTLVAGFVPWTLAVLMLAIFTNYRNVISSLRTWAVARRKLRELNGVNVLSAIAAVSIFVFYCIPQSKRSVYLMPMYPFVALFVAQYIECISRKRIGVMKCFGDIMASASCVLFVAFALVKMGLVPDALFGNGRHAAQNVAMMDSIASLNGFWVWALALVSPVGGLAWWFKLRTISAARTIAVFATVPIIAVYVSLAALYQPAVLNVKSVKTVSKEINSITANGDVYEFISAGEFAAGDPVHYFELNFYIGNRISSFYKAQPDKGFLVIGHDDATKYFPEFEADGYSFQNIYTASKKLLGQTTSVYSFAKSAAPKSEWATK